MKNAGGVSHFTLQLVGFLGSDDLRRVPDEATHPLHPVQVVLVEDLKDNSNIKGHLVWSALLMEVCGGSGAGDEP